MRSGRFRMLVVVIAVAAIAFGVYRHEHHSLALNTGGPPPISVLVAEKPIQKGTSGDVIRTIPGYYKVDSLRRGQIETNPIIDPSELAGRVAVKDIPPGQELTTAEFAVRATGPEFPSPCCVVVIKPTSPDGIGRQITDGSYVDVWVATRHGPNTLRKLYRNMYVLDARTSGGTVTILATPLQAEEARPSGKANDRLVVRLHR